MPIGFSVFLFSDSFSSRSLDSSIVSGLIALILKVYNGSNAREILESDISFMDRIGFSQHLSPARNNGLHSIINYVYKAALRHNDEKKS